MKIAVAAVAVAFLVLGAAAAHAAPPKPLQLKQRCVTKAERRGIVRFTAPDRVRLIGVVFGRGPNAVVLAHQGGGGGGEALCSWVPYARSLARAGYRVLAFDHRGRGSSSVPSRPDRLARIHADVMGAVALLRSRGATRVVVGGASLGGAAAVAAAAQIRPAVQGVFTLGAPQAFGSADAGAAARVLQVPALFMAAEDDDPFDDEARALYDVCTSVDKRLAVLPGSRHGAPQLRDPQAKGILDAWIADHLRS